MLSLRSLLPAVFFVPLLLNAQHRPTYPAPPGSMDRIGTVGQAHPDTVAHRSTDPVQLTRQARELADLAGTLPVDIDQINHGLLPKDTADKLKRIEKLAKQLRSQVSP